MKSPALSSLADAIEQAAARGAAQVEPEPMPEGLTGLAADLWIVEREIEATLRQIAKARAIGNDLRIPALQTQLDRWMDRRRELRPPAAADPAEEDRKWRAAGEEVLRKIESGVSAVEERQRRERAATGAA